MRRLLREPLFHFALGGVALFAIYGLVSAEGSAPGVIVVDEARIANLASGFERTWLRPPNRAELEGLIEEHVQEEVYYREALALGLDEDDLIIRRRLRQKMEFLGTDLAVPREPDDEELERYLAEHPERFERPATTSFVQVFVEPTRHGPDPGAYAASLLARLREEGAESGLGDATLLPAGMRAASPVEIAGRFGEEFARALAPLAPGEWAGPIESAYGLHLVKVSAREAPSLPALGEIRPLVEREWSSEMRERANRRFYDALRERYRVEVRLPAGEPPGADG